MRCVDVIAVFAEEPIAAAEQFANRCCCRRRFARFVAFMPGDFRAEIAHQLAVQMPHHHGRGRLLLAVAESRHFRIVGRDRVARAVLIDDPLQAERRCDTFAQCDLDQLVPIFFRRRKLRQRRGNGRRIAERPQIHPCLADFAGVPQQPSRLAARREIRILDFAAQRFFQVLERRRENDRQPEPPPSLHQPSVEKFVISLFGFEPFRQPLQPGFDADALRIALEVGLQLVVGSGRHIGHAEDGTS